MTIKDSLSQSRTAQELRGDPNYIQVFDAYGRELFITKEQWRTGSLPAALKKAWENPDQLYGVIAMALRDGFFTDVRDAAAHLYRTDTVPERGATIYGIVLMKTQEIDQAERVFLDYLSRYAPDGTILTNLAKVYAEQGHPQKAEATLWRALEVDPNLDNALAWYSAIRREHGGDEADAIALGRVAALPKSWRAQLWQARTALQSSDIAKALALYRVALLNVGTPAPTDLLMQMSGDLGNSGHLSEALALTEAAYSPAEHGLLVGNNLVKANLDLGHVDAAAKILAQLYSLRRPDWTQQLSFWDTEIAKARIAAIPLNPGAPFASTIICIDGPVWLKPESPAASLFPQRLARESLVTFLGGSATMAGGSDQISLQLANQPGRLSRALPLFLAEQPYFRTGALTQVLIPWAQTQPGAFILSGVAWPDSDAVKYALMAAPKSLYVVVTHLTTSHDGSPDPWKVDVRVVRTSDATCVWSWSVSFAPAAMEESFTALTKSLVELLKSWLPGTSGECPSLYQVPEGQLPDYLLRLEQMLAARCAGLETPDRGSLSGEREMIGGMLDLCLRNPLNVVVRVVFAQTLLAMKSSRPEVILSFKDKVDRLQAEFPLGGPAKIILAGLFDKAFS